MSKKHCYIQIFHILFYVIYFFLLLLVVRFNFFIAIVLFYSIQTLRCLWPWCSYCCVFIQFILLQQHNSFAKVFFFVFSPCSRTEPEETSEKTKIQMRKNCIFFFFFLATTTTKIIMMAKKTKVKYFWAMHNR